MSFCLALTDCEKMLRLLMKYACPQARLSRLISPDPARLYVAIYTYLPGAYLANQCLLSEVCCVTVYTTIALLPEL